MNKEIINCVFFLFKYQIKLNYPIKEIYFADSNYKRKLLNMYTRCSIAYDSEIVSRYKVSLIRIH